jgi:hypothetical protein
MINLVICACSFVVGFGFLEPRLDERVHFPHRIAE